MMYKNLNSAGRRYSYTPKFQPAEESNEVTPRPFSVIFTNNPIGEISEYVNSDRQKIVLTLPTDEEVNKMNTLRLIGKDIKQTIKLNYYWISRLMRFFVYYIVGVLYFEHAENWSFLDSVYFITQTISTVGYGNLSPKTYDAQTFTTFYIYVGFLMVFSVIGEIAMFFVLFMRSNYVKPVKLNKMQVLVRSTINCAMWLTILFLVPIFGATVFSLNEGWSFHEAYYFAVVTVSSTGYGDMSLSKDSSIWFNCFYILVAVALTALSLDKIASFKRHLEEAELWQILDEVQPSKALIDAINKKEGRASRAEYILHMLQLEGKLDYIQDISRWKEKFEEFDIDKDGYITMNDVNHYSKLIKKRNKVASSRAPRKRSVISQVADETKDVLMETLGRRTKSTDRNQQVTEETFQNSATPRARAKALKRASALDGEDEGGAESPRSSEERVNSVHQSKPVFNPMDPLNANADNESNIQYTPGAPVSPANKNRSQNQSMSPQRTRPLSNTKTVEQFEIELDP